MNQFQIDLKNVHCVKVKEGHNRTNLLIVTNKYMTLVKKYTIKNI